MKLLRSHNILIGIFAVALMARVLYFGVSFHAQNYSLVETISGADGYYLISENLLHGHGYSSRTEEPYTLNSVRPPMMPYFLALSHGIFDSYVFPLVLLLLMGSVIPLFGMRLAQDIFSDARITYITGLFLALEPFSILFSTFFYSETLFIFLFLGSLVLLFRYMNSGSLWFGSMSAVLLGLSILTKPTGQYLPFVFALVVLVHFARRLGLSRAAYMAGVYMVVTFLVVLPWVYRNYMQFGAATLSSLQGAALYVILVPSVLSLEHGTTFQQEYAAIMREGGTDPNSTDVTQSEEFTARAIPILLAHPKSLVLVTANTSLNFFIHDGVHDVLRHVGIKPESYLGKPALFLLISDPMKVLTYTASVATKPIILILFARLFWIVLTLFFVVGAVHFLMRRATSVGVVALIVVLYFLVTTLVVGLSVNARYRLPVNAFLVSFAAYGLMVTAPHLRHKLRWHTKNSQS